jgi:hypothetical protein
VPVKQLYPEQKLGIFELVKMIYATAFLFATVGHGEVTTFSVTPSATDPEIKTFNEPYWIYGNRDIVVEDEEDSRIDSKPATCRVPRRGIRPLPA